MFSFEVGFLTSTLKILLLMKLGDGSGPFSQPHINPTSPEPVCVSSHLPKAEKILSRLGLGPTVTGNMSFITRVAMGYW